MGDAVVLHCDGIHFVTNDKGLRATHKEDYDRYGRWVLAVSITIGWIIAAFTEVNILVISVLSAFIAGGVILNVMKEELPEERESSFPAFFQECWGMQYYCYLCKVTGIQKRCSMEKWTVTRIIDSL